MPRMEVKAMSINSDTVSFTEEKKTRTAFLLSDKMADLNADSLRPVYHNRALIQGNLYRKNW